MGRGGGGGGLRILPHKSWNVYNRDNIERVKADEAAHAAEQAILEAKRRAAESEYNLQRMRRRLAQQQSGEEEKEDEPPEEAIEQQDDSLSDDERVVPRAASRAGRPVRFEVSQEEARMNEQPTASDPALPINAHFTLFPDVAGTEKRAAESRLSRENARTQAVAAARRVAPVSLFVEGVRGEDGQGLRPWYGQDEEERAAMAAREKQKLKQKVHVRRGADGRVRLELNPTGEIKHTELDPLEQMRSGLRQLESYEVKNAATGTPSAAASVAALAAPPLHRMLSSPPPLQPATPTGAPARRTRWDAADSLGSMHYAPGVGFTNAPEAVLRHVVSSQPPPLFAAGAAAVAGAAVPVAPAASSLSRRRSRSRSRSASASSDSEHHRSKRSRTKEKKKKKKHKKHHRKHSSKKRSRSRSRTGSNSSSSRSRSRSREHKRRKPDAHTGAIPPPPLVPTPSSAMIAALRAEREDRERAEREKAAALLQVPVWATSDPRALSQLQHSDDLLERQGRRGRR